MDPVHSARFEAISTELAQSHQIAKGYHKELVGRLHIAFTPAPELPRRGKPAAGETRGKRNDGNYRHCRARDGYLEALKAGSCFFLVFILSFGKSHSNIPAVKYLIQRKYAVKFSLDQSTRNVITAWAQGGNYSDNEDFIIFFNGLPSLQGLSAVIALDGS